MKLYKHPLIKRFKITPYLMVLALFAFLGGVLIYELKAQYEKTLSEAATRAMQRSQFISQSLHSKLISSDYVLRDVLGHVQAKDLVYPDPDQKHLDAMIKLLKTKSDTVPYLFTMVFFNKDCVFTALDTGQHMGASSSKDWCESAKAHQIDAPMVIFVPSKQSPSGVGVVSISRILRSPTGEFEGAAVAAMEIGTLQKWLEGLSINSNDAVAIFDESRTLLARYPFVADKIETPVIVPEVDELIASKAPSVTSTREGIDGHIYVLGFSKVAQFPFYVTYGFDKDKLLDSWRLHAIELIISYLIIFGLAMLTVHIAVKAQKGRLGIELEKSRLDEREMLLQDMHDGFGSQLASAHLMAQQGKVSPEQITVILNECLSDLYLVMDTLSGSSETLAEAIADYRYRLESRLVDTGLTLHWKIELDGAPDVTPRIALQLLRILQEAIGNVLKHAKANNVWIDIDYSQKDHMLHLSVNDDGLGLPATSELPKGRGLPGMKGRARTIGAHFHVGNRSDAAGTQVTLSLNLA